MSQFTRGNLDSALATINVTVSRLGTDYYLAAQGRNGYVAVDLCTHAGGCQRALATGTARDCLNGANAWLSAIVFDFADEHREALNKLTA